MDNAQQEKRVMLGVQEVATMMGIGINRAYDVMHSKKFPVHRIGRRYLVHREVFEKWLKGEYIKPN